jgi:RHS repeat-associated protein
LITTSFGNGTQEIRQYDVLNRLTYLENHKGDTILSSYAYTLDKVGNRTKVVENDSRTVDYSYDNLYRLTKEQITDSVYGDRASEFTYDKVGNRLIQSENVGGTVTTTAYVYDANDRLLREVVDGQVAVSYDYDANGNTLSKQDASGSTLYDWNDEGRLVGAIVLDGNGDPKQQMKYHYNSDGIRVASSLDEQQTHYLLDNSQAYAQVLEEYNNTGTLQVAYTFGNDLINQTRNGLTTFYMVDGLGSTRLLTDVQGNVLNIYDYDAFGETISQSGNVDNQYLFTGEQFDQGLGDYYLRDRFYDQSVGRFTRKDIYEGRLGEPLTLHDYLYTHNNPINNTDPTGLFTLSETLRALSLVSSLSALVGVMAYAPSMVAGSRGRQNSDTVVIYVGTGTVVPLTWPAGHSFIEVDGEVYTFPPPPKNTGLSDPAPRDPYIFEEQTAYGYEYNRYSINYNESEKQTLKANLAKNRQSPLRNDSDYDLFSRNCTHYVTSSLPKIDSFFDAFVTGQTDPLGLGWGLDVVAATKKNLVNRLTKVKRLPGQKWRTSP